MKRLSGVLLVAGACLLNSGTFAADTINLMHKQPTKYELIKALKVQGKKTRGLQPSATERAPSVDLTVNFEFDSANLTEDAMVTLATIADALTSKELKDQRFLIEGHTDAIGPEDYNNVLSERRASAVSAYLINQQDVSSDRLSPIGKGEGELLAPETPDAPENRRVRVKVLMD